MYFLNINKPKGVTSFDVIRNLRKRLNIKQIGHSGTLDPLASGVLQIAVGGCTKLLDYLASDKTYIAEIIFGYNTSTYDDEGDKVFVSTPNFSKQELIDVLDDFVGKTLQIPPKFSAIKQNGTKLCSLARKSPEVEIKIEPREIEIYSIELQSFYSDTATIKVYCKKGTYIRSLTFDIGAKLGCGAYIKELKRIAAGNFLIENSNNLDDEEYNEINPLDVLLFDKKELTDEEFSRILNGNYIKTEEKFKTDEVLLTKNNKLVSIAKTSDNLIMPKKLFKENL